MGIKVYQLTLRSYRRGQGISKVPHDAVYGTYELAFAAAMEWKGESPYRTFIVRENTVITTNKKEARRTR